MLDLDKLQELLGEELAATVQEKLSEQKVELAIFNNGSVVKADKYETLKEEHKALNEKYQTDMSEVNNKLENAVNGAVDYEALKGTLEQLKTENQKLAETHEQELINIKMDSFIDVELLKANVKPGYEQILKSQINKGSLKFDGDNLIGLGEQIKSLQEKFSDTFGEVKIVGANPNGGTKNPPQGKRQQLVEQYNKAEKDGNVREMFVLNKQIKALQD